MIHTVYKHHAVILYKYFDIAYRFKISMHIVYRYKISMHIVYRFKIKKRLPKRVYRNNRILSP